MNEHTPRCAGCLRELPVDALLPAVEPGDPGRYCDACAQAVKERLANGES